MSTRSLPAEVRERLRAHQEREAKVLAMVAAAATRREVAVTRRVEIVAAQDHLIQAAVAEEAAAIVELVATSGIERAASILDIPVPALRKLVKVAEHRA
jgi:hypothetical protein